MQKFPGTPQPQPRIVVPGSLPPSPAPSPFQATVDPVTMMTTIRHFSGVQVVISKEGLTAIQSASGSFLRFLPDGSCEIVASAIRFITPQESTISHITLDAEAKPINQREI